VDIPSHHYNQSAVGLNIRSIIVLATMPTNITIIMMILLLRLAQLLLHSSANSPVDPNWYVDSRATNHLTIGMVNLVVHSEYQRFDRVHMGNGICLPICSTNAFYCVLLLLLS